MYDKNKPDIGKVDKTKLRGFLMYKYNPEQLEILSNDIKKDLANDNIDLKLSWNTIGGESLADKISHLIEFLDEPGYLSYLINNVGRTYPSVFKDIEKTPLQQFLDEEKSRTKMQSEQDNLSKKSIGKVPFEVKKPGKEAEKIQDDKMKPAFIKEKLKIAKPKTRKSEMWLAIIAAILIFAVALVGIKYIYPYVTGNPVPDVINMTISTAESIIKNEGFQIGNITYEVSQDVAKDKVIRQIPEAGSREKSGTIINLVVSGGSKAIVPDLKGKTLEEAATLLTNANLKLGSKTAEFTDDPELIGQISAQSVAAGQKLESGQTVNVTYYSDTVEEVWKQAYKDLLFGNQTVQTQLTQINSQYTGEFPLNTNIGENPNPYTFQPGNTYFQLVDLDPGGPPELVVMVQGAVSLKLSNGTGNADAWNCYVYTYSNDQLRLLNGYESIGQVVSFYYDPNRYEFISEGSQLNNRFIRIDRFADGEVYYYAFYSLVPDGTSSYTIIEDGIYVSTNETTEAVSADFETISQRRLEFTHTPVNEENVESALSQY